MYEKIKRWYDSRLWTADMVRNAVTKGLITEQEHREIVEANK